VRHQMRETQAGKLPLSSSLFPCPPVWPSVRPVPLRPPPPPPFPCVFCVFCCLFVFCFVSLCCRLRSWFPACLYFQQRILNRTVRLHSGEQIPLFVAEPGCERQLIIIISDIIKRAALMPTSQLLLLLIFSLSLQSHACIEHSPLLQFRSSMHASSTRHVCSSLLADVHVCFPMVSSYAYARMAVCWQRYIFMLLLFSLPLCVV